MENEVIYPKWFQWLDKWGSVLVIASITPIIALRIAVNDLSIYHRLLIAYMCCGVYLAFIYGLATFVKKKKSYFNQIHIDQLMTHSTD